MSGGEWLGFHGLVLRTRDPHALAARLSRILGWKRLGATRREIVIGRGPEMFLAIRGDVRAGERVILKEVHVAVRNIAELRRKAKPDPLGGDSWSQSAGAELSLTAREFQRPPRGRWRPRRKSR